jgi:hypothetical protein
MRSGKIELGRVGLAAVEWREIAGMERVSAVRRFLFLAVTG